MQLNPLHKNKEGFCFFNRVIFNYQIIEIDISSKKRIRQDQVNLLIYCPERIYFKQKQKNNVTKFWPTGFFLSYYFLLFEKTK